MNTLMQVQASLPQVGLLLLFAWLVIKRQWSPFGLLVGATLCFISWFDLRALDDSFASLMRERAAMGHISIGDLSILAWPVSRVTLFVFGMTGAMIHPSMTRTLGLLAACIGLMFNACIPAIRWVLGLEPASIIQFRGVHFSPEFAMAMNFALGIMVPALAIPWCLSRQSNTRKTLISPILDKFAIIFGLTLAVSVLMASAIMCGEFRGTGPFSGEPLFSAFKEAQHPVPPIFILFLLVAAAFASFWALWSAFILPAISLIEASQRFEEGSLPEKVHPLWKGYVANLNDRIKEAGQKSAELAELGFNLQAFLDNSPMVMFVTDLEGNFLVTNNYVRPDSVTGDHVKNHQVGHNESEYATPEWSEINRQMYAEVISTGQTVVRHAIVETGEEPIHVSMTRFPIRSANGAIERIGAIIADVTEQERAERALAEREALLSGIFDHVPVGIVVFNRDYEMMLVNRTTANTYSVEPDQLRGAPLDSFRPYWPRLDEMIAVGLDVLEKGQSRQITVPFDPPADAPSQTKECVLFPIRDASGEVSQVGLFIIDVTKQQKALEELHESRSQFEAFVRNAPLPMGVADLKANRIVMANEEVANAYGLPLEDLLKLDLADLSHFFPEWASTVVPNLETVLSGGTNTPVEVNLRNLTTGEVRARLQSNFPIPTLDESKALIGSISVDITDLKQAEAALAEQQAHMHQSEKLAALGQLLAGVAHELNNPLTVVVGRSAILEEKLRDTPHAKAIADMREAADRCSRIVKTFLAMARQAAPRRSSVQINDAIEAALDMVSYGMRSSGIVVERHFAPDLPEVDADEDQLVQVFTNLLINALHALEEEGVEGPALTLSTHLKKGQVVAEFSDNGPGVPEHIAARIFEPFFTTKEVGEGTGMGLAMSRGMIEEHGGTLSLSATPGGGATFRVTLPLGVPANAGAAETALPDQAASGSNSRRGRALIVDDEPSIRALLAEMLADLGIGSVECADGQEGLAQIAAGNFDIVFCDIRMPNMDGLQFHKRVAADHPDALDRIVFMSGDVLTRSAPRYAAIAGHTIIDKPFRPAEVREVALAMLDKTGDKS